MKKKNNFVLRKRSKGGKKRRVFCGGQEWERGIVCKDGKIKNIVLLKGTVIRKRALFRIVVSAEDGKMAQMLRFRV